MDSDGLRRRRFLLGTGTAGILALAGCISDGNLSNSANTSSNGDDGDGAGDDGNGGSTDAAGDESPTVDDVETPEATVRAFFGAFDSGDADQVNAFVHADAPLGELSQEEATEAQETGLALQSLQNTSVDGENATVEVRVSSDDVEEWGEGPRPFVVELRREDDEWRVWDVRPPGESGVDTVAPQVAFSIDSEGTALRITHDGGDTVQATNLSVRGEGLARTGSWAELGGGTTTDSDGNPVIAAGNSLTVESEDEYTVRLVWEGDGDSAVLAEMAGARETASESEVEENPEDPTEAQQFLDDANGFDGSIQDFTGEDPVVVEVGVTDGSDGPFAFSPPAIRVDPGVTVRWQWVGDSAHTVTAVDGRFDSEVRTAEDSSFSVSFAEPGVNLYYCAPHRALGMKGAVIVADE